jgi:hypothetical protein
MEFNLVQLAITVRTADAASLALWLPQMGSGYSAACRSLVCRNPDRPCASCSRQDSCPWHLVFGQKLAVDPSELKRHQKPPLPFMFSFPAGSTPSGGHAELSCGLVVVGCAIPHLGMLLDGFTELLACDASPVSGQVTSMGTRDYQGLIHPLGDMHAIGHPHNLTVLSAAGLLEACPWGCSELNIRMLTPLRLFDDGHLLDRFDFSLFIRSLMRRVSSLAYYYGAYEYDCDFKALSLQADSVTCSEDHFRLQSGSGRKLSGITGQGRFHGDLSGLMPFLILGSYIHAGKGASYGMGVFELFPGGGD